MEGRVGLSSWLYTEINVWHRELNPDAVTHLSTVVIHDKFVYAISWSVGFNIDILNHLLIIISSVYMGCCS